MWAPSPAAFACPVGSIPVFRRQSGDNLGHTVGEELLIEAIHAPPPPDSVLAALGEELVSGLLRQLRSIPVGMRVDAWLTANYPSLADQQAESLAAQQQEALSCLSPQVRALAPDEIVSASILLNTAHAIFCDRLLGITQYQVPYASSGFKDLGETLVKVFDEMPPDPSSDCALVDRWAREIGLDGKYAWVPLRSANARPS